MKKIIVFGLIVGALASCSYSRDPNSRGYDPNDPGYEYAPDGDMYYSVAYQPMTQYERNNNPFNKDSMNMRMPVWGTIARGKMDYFFPFKNTPEDYQKSESFSNPYPATSENLLEGRMAFETVCWQCHGKEGAEKGSLIAGGKFPNPTWSFENMTLLKSLSPGKMFFSITYGKNLMGPHGHIVTPEQRWKIISYLQFKAVNQTLKVSDTAKTTLTDSTKTKLK